eukprot:CAMPEP_0197176268 /NCGR_PEP_ID=MMETSP1423-20130617/2257_1 /TAXON_ID=476441 /ORGANISM="Pseudo-nitzschia heimii, Strain UNC1101" /LENGTH=333 /DNA_ID=CAMNT_0042625621 /DNA_START=115 /DNA_END=1113 /DNA_ORIENTATION=+
MVMSAMSDSFRAICLALTGLAIVSIANGDLTTDANVALSSDMYHVRSFEENKVRATQVIDYDNSDGIMDPIGEFLAQEGIWRHLRPKKKKPARTQILDKTEVLARTSGRTTTPTNLRECLLDALEFFDQNQISTRLTSPPRRTSVPNSLVPSEGPSLSPLPPGTITPSDLASTNQTPSLSTTSDGDRSNKSVQTSRRRQGRRLWNGKNDKESMNDVFQSFIGVDSHLFDYDDEYDESLHDYYDDEGDEYFQPPSWLSGHTYDEMNRELSTCDLPSLKEEKIKKCFDDFAPNICVPTSAPSMQPSDAPSDTTPRPTTRPPVIQAPPTSEPTSRP